ncbi:hypothetical protein UFOVP22_24 [uncultured Caudovirales phage]|uniref:Uncharacterized protein n=1 Tax=uncultured Caudovirales phage TaxID=2100421 RepID=A0A6J5T8A3_9CAUD|nr:hypothetical protein UFOVP22_24 [uncultured Caudovirales phage]
MTKLKATMMWSNLHHVNEMSGKYQVDLTNLSDKAIEELAKDGITAVESKKAGDERGVYITCKSTYPILAYYDDGSEVPSNIQIGNGTLAVATIKPYEWNFKGKTGVSPTIVRLIVTKLIEYGNEEFDDEGEAV